MNKTVALVTYSGLPELSEDDRPLLPALGHRGVDARPVAWDRSIDWNQFDQIILRSCWNYPLRKREFLDWVDRIEKLGVPIYNSAKLIRWNADKRYLLQLQNAGIRIPETVWGDDEEDLSVHGILESRGWDSAVVKPTVSASAYCLKRVHRNEPKVRVRGPAMIQPFIHEVQRTGEWSIVFINAEFSHAVVKLPAPGDFRVQSQFGGTAAVAQADRRTIDSAKRIVDSLPEEPLYARVDGIVVEDGFLLMELELIEPELFLRLGSAVERLADNIASLL